MIIRKIHLFMIFSAVSIFHGRLHHGKLNLGSAQLDAPDHMHVANTEAVGYVRPHHMKIERIKQSEDAILTKVIYAHSVGSILILK